MLVSCSYCGGRHKRGFICPSRPKRKHDKKEASYIHAFRSSRLWQKKRDEIKKRDKYLCQWCLLESRYVFKDLAVHHIFGISRNWAKRLDNYNLITLCSACHKMADNGNIKADELTRLVVSRNPI